MNDIEDLKRVRKDRSEEEYQKEWRRAAVSNDEDDNIEDDLMFEPI